MDKAVRNRHIYSIIMKSTIIIGFFVGVLYMALADKQYNSVLMSFTIQANLLATMCVAILLVLDSITLAKKQEQDVPNWILLVKFVATVAVTLSILIYVGVLYPYSFHTGEPINIVSVSNFFVHIFLPLLLIEDFIVFDYCIRYNKYTALYGLIMPAYFICLFAIMSKGGAPWFFLDYAKLSWFGIGMGKFGIIYSCLIIAGLTVGIGYLLLYFMKIRAKSKSKEKLKKIYRGIKKKEEAQENK